MFSLKSVLLAAFVAVAQADYYVEPKSVSANDRKYWCSAELSTCPLICKQTPPGTVLVNTCDWETLQYGCVCGNGLKPNVSEYSLTIPYFVCTEWGTQCEKACGISNSQCASDCRQNNRCGAQNPTRVNSTSSTSSAGPTATAAGGTFDGLAGGEGAGSSANGKNFGTALVAGESMGMMVLLGGAVAGFALLL